MPSLACRVLGSAKLNDDEPVDASAAVLPGAPGTTAPVTVSASANAVASSDVFRDLVMDPPSSNPEISLCPGGAEIRHINSGVTGDDLHSGP
ncbi:hypothetical protein GCM10029976_038870 [Kribbella albertanoniae]